MTIDTEQLRADMEAAVNRIRKYVDWPHTSPDTIVLDRDLVTITADDLASLLQQFDALQADLQATQQREADANKKAMKHLRRAEKSEIAAANYANFSHEWHQRVEKAEVERDALHEQNRKLREALDRALPWSRLAECVMEDWAAHCDVDAGDCFDWAVRFGVLVPIEGGFNPEVHIDEYGGAEAGDPWYELAPAPAALAEGETE